MSDKTNSHRKISLLARIAWMYYIQELTQEEIARKLDFSRTKVTRLLAQAREEGINDLRRSALDKVAEGVTDLIETNRVTRD